MKIIGTIIKAIFVAYLVIFAVINMQSVQLTLFFKMAPFSMPMFLFTILIIFIGFIAGITMMMGEKFSSNSQIKQLKKQLQEAGNEIMRLKNIPLTAGNQAEKTSEVSVSADTEAPANHNAAIKDVLR